MASRILAKEVNMETDSAPCISKMQVVHHQDGSRDIPDENCSMLSSNQTHDDGFISISVCTDTPTVADDDDDDDDNASAFALPFVTCNASTTDLATIENTVSCKDSHCGAPHKVDATDEIGSVAALVICGSNKIDSRKFTDKVTEGKEVCQEMKCDSACGLQLQLGGRNSSNSPVPVERNSCGHDFHISNNNSVVKDCDKKSPCPHTVDNSKAALNSTYSANSVDSFAFTCIQDATRPSSCGYKTKPETHMRVSLSGEIVTAQSKVNCVTPPNEILVPHFMMQHLSGKPETVEVNVDSKGMKAVLHPAESMDVSQTYADSTRISVATKINENTVNTSSVEAAIISQSNTPCTSAGFSTCSMSFVPNVTCWSSEPPLNQNMGLSHPMSLPSGGICIFNTSRSKIVSFSDSCTSEPSWLDPHVNSSVTKTQNFGSFLKSVTSCATVNNPFQKVADRTKGSFSFSLKSEQNTASDISNVFSNISALDTPFKYSASTGSCIPDITNKSSVPVLDRLLRESSVFSGFKFCTLSPPILSSTVSQPMDASFHFGSESSAMGFPVGSETSFKCGTPCTESAMDTALSIVGTAVNTCLKPRFMRSGVKVDSNVVNTLGQNSGSHNTTVSLDTATATCASFGTLVCPALTTQSSSVSTNLFGQVPRIECLTSVVSSTEATAGSAASFQFGNQTSSSSAAAAAAGRGPEVLSFSSFSSAPVFGSDLQFPKFEYVKDTSVRKNKFGNSFQVNSLGRQSSREKASSSTACSTVNSALFTFGSTAVNCNGVTNAFDSHVIRKPVTTVTSSGFNTGIINNAFTFAIPSSASDNVLFKFRGSAQNKLRFHSAPSKQVPFKIVRDNDTYIKNGVISTFTVQHQHITAMPEYSSLSFEELRLQYDKYNLNRQTEHEAIMVDKKVQTTESILGAGTHLTDMWKILECPVCLEIVTPPVVQCERGHHVCNHCWKRITSCPLCKRYRSGTRNYVAEAMVEKLPLPCKYRVDGCTKMMCQVDKATHEKTCLFRTYTCLVDDCNQAHSFKDMTVHLKTSHRHLISGNYFCISKWQKFSHTMVEHSFQSLVHAFDISDWGLFFLCHKKSGQNTCLWIQVINNTSATETEFLYSIEVADMQELQSVSYKGPVLPLHTVTNEQQYTCLVITNLLLGALKKNSGCNIKVSIWQK